MSLLIILPKPSRFDSTSGGLLSGPAKRLVDECLPSTPYDVTLADRVRPETFARYSHVIRAGVFRLDLNSERGFVYGNTVTTYYPQDCCDLRNYEGGEDDAADDDGASAKDSAPTRRTNFRFWFKRDVEKLFAPPPERYAFSYNLLSPERAAGILANATGSHLFFDLESHPASNSLTCFSFALDNGPVWSVPIYSWNQCLVPGAVRCMAALARAFSRNKVVIHNAAFDLLFLAMFHHIPFGPNLACTMLMGHRIYPEADKSLHHVITLYANYPYHKDSGGTWFPRDTSQLHKLMHYNALDVHRLREVYYNQLDYAAKVGAASSVSAVNSEIFANLYISLHGMPLNIQVVRAVEKERLARAAQLQRILNIIVGYELNPRSTHQLADYFITRLKYNVIDRTPEGGPVMDIGALYKYQRNSQNPAIAVIIAIKQALKVASDCGMRVWCGPVKRVAGKIK